MQLSNNEFFSWLEYMYLIKKPEKLSHSVFTEREKKGLRNKRGKEKKKGRAVLLGGKCTFFSF